MRFLDADDMDVDVVSARHGARAFRLFRNDNERSACSGPTVSDAAPEAAPSLVKNFSAQFLPGE